MSEIQSKENAVGMQVQETEVVELNREEVKEVVTQVIQEIEFRGPIPPPNILGEYERMLPGAADRILSMAENQSNHRQIMEKKMIAAESRDSLLGILFGFILGMGCVVAAIIMALAFPESVGVISGAVLGTTGVASIAGTVIRSTRRGHKKESEETTEEEKE